MAGRERFVVIGAARGDTTWFHEVSRWAMSGELGIEYLKALDVAEVRSRLAAGRRYSAVLLDGHLDRIDLDLVDAAHRAGAAVFVVGGPRRDWSAIAVDAALSATLTPDVLHQTLGQFARPVDSVESPLTLPDPAAVGGDAPGRFVAVTGAGGSGVSIVAAAVAQVLANPAASSATAPPPDAPASNVPASTVLVDFALRGDQALYHHTGEVVPGVVELVDAFRHRAPDAAGVRRHTFDLPDRGYHLLVGLRRPREWSTLRPAAARAAIDGLTRAFTTVVADIDADFDGEHETGSLDIEARNTLSRLALDRADLVVVVSRPGVQGVHRLVRLVHDLRGHGIESERLILVVNRVPRRPGRRAGVVRAVHALLADETVGDIPSPVFVPEVVDLDTTIHDALPLPSRILDPLASTVGRRLRASCAVDNAGGRGSSGARRGQERSAEPVPVAVGSLGALGGPSLGTETDGDAGPDGPDDPGASGTWEADR